MSEDVARKLLDFGLTNKEASIYVALLRDGKGRAGEIARKLQLNRMIVYRVLTKLQERELVKATVEKPMKFIPIPLEKALGLLMKENESKLEAMRNRYDAVIERWKTIDSEPAAVDVLSFKVVQGRKQIYELLLKMFISANDRIRIVTDQKDLLRFQYVDIDDALKRAAKRGVKIQIIVQYEEDKLDVIRNYVNFAAVKIVPFSKATRFFIADDKEMIIAFTTDDSMVLNTKRETSLKIQSTDGESLNTLVDIFTNFWESADELDVLGSISSKSTEDVRTFKTEQVFNNTLQRMIQAAQSELTIGIARDTPKQTKDMILEEVAKRAGQLYIRVILYLDQEDIDKRQDLLSKTDAYHSDLLRNMQFIIRDRKEILTTLRLKGAEAGSRFKYIWSNSPLYVESMMGIINELWENVTKIEDRVSDLKRGELSTSCFSEFKSILEQRKWKVKIPSNKGETRMRSEFGLLAENGNGQKLAAQFISGGEYRNLAAMSSFYGNAMNAGVDTLYLIAIPTPTEQETNFAQYCSMNLITAENRNGLSSKLSEIGKAIPSP